MGYPRPELLTSTRFGKLVVALLGLALCGCGRHAANTLKAGYGNAYPMTYSNESGHASGFVVEVLEEAARRDGVTIQWVLAGAKSPNEMLQSGEIDLLATGVVTPERRKLFFVSEPWWGGDQVALSAVGGPIQREPDLAGRRLAVTAAGALEARRLHPSETVIRGSAREVTEEVCAGRADAAILAGVFLRELLAAMPAACRGFGLQTIDLPQQWEYALISRRDVEGSARRLRSRITELTLDGTLSRLASSNPPVSTPYATRLAELLRARYERRVSIFGLAGLGALLLLVSGFFIRLNISRRRLRLANDALRHSEQRFRALVETTSDWFWEVDAMGRYTAAGPQVQALLGYSPEEVLGITPFDLMPPDEAARVRDIFLEAVAARRPLVAIENTNLHKNGALVVLETSGVPVFGPGGELLGYRGMDRDITDRKRQELWRAAQATVSRALAAGRPVSDTLERVLQALGGIGHWEAGFVWHANGIGGPQRCLGFWRAESLDDTVAADIHNLMPSLVDRLAHVVVSSARIGTAPTADCRTALEWALGVPMSSGNRTSGAIILLGRTASDLDDRFIEMLSAVGSQVGEFLERAQAQEALRRFVDCSPTVLYALKVEPQGLVPTFVSSNLLQLTGHHPEESLASSWWRENVHPDDLARVAAANSVPYQIDHQVLEFRLRRRDGSYVWLRDEKRLLRDSQANPSEVVGTWSDISQRVQLEEQLLQSQKLEAIGALAGGIAHDFNNLLTVMNGYSALALKSLLAGSPAHRQIEEVIRAGERAAGLTRQLLAFSRRQELSPRVIPLHSIISGVQKMLRRLIGEDIDLFIRNRASGRINADPGQIEQVLMNLVVNARDAMQRGGTLTVATADRSIPEGHAEVPPGMFVELSVSDTGVGMDPEVQRRIFEPFFTTKVTGKGTGLGLSTVYGIVKQSGGFIEVESCPGQGSTFRVLFPVAAGGAEAEAPLFVETAWNGTETILLVEDEDAVRQVARETLESRGYRILEATNAGEALLISEELPPGELHLLLSDIVMPRVNGIELAERILRNRPETRVLFMTGYVDQKLMERDAFASKAACLQKPYTPLDLAREVRRVLDGAVQPQANPG